MTRRTLITTLLAALPAWLVPWRIKRPKIGRSGEMPYQEFLADEFFTLPGRCNFKPVPDNETMSFRKLGNYSSWEYAVFTSGGGRLDAPGAWSQIDFFHSLEAAESFLNKTHGMSLYA